MRLIRGFRVYLLVGYLSGLAFGDDRLLQFSLEEGAAAYRTPAGELVLDLAPTLKFIGKDKIVERRLAGPKVERLGGGRLELRYETTGPDEKGIRIIRRITTNSRPGEADFAEQFTLIPTADINVDLEIEWPFRIRKMSGATAGLSSSVAEKSAKNTAGHASSGAISQHVAAAVLPTFDGRAKSMPLSSQPIRGQWRMCNWITDVPSEPLGLPVVQIGEKGCWLGAVCADAEFASLFELKIKNETPRKSRVGQAKRGPTKDDLDSGGTSLRLSHPTTTNEDGDIRGAVRFRYASSKVPLRAGEKEVRRFGVWLAKSREKEPFGRSIDAYFRLMLPDVPPGPEWLHEIAMVGYDYLSDGGEGWERDVRELARLLKPDQRRRVALCFHGWYDTLGGYSFDDRKKEIKPEWIAMARTRKVPMSVESMRRKLKLARDLGFRALVYFADGLNQDDGAPSYRAEWDLAPLGGKRLAGWTGPDTWGQTYVRNPAHPEVFQWYQDYLDAMIRAFGPAVDGFVWDETFHVEAGTIALAPRPAYCDRAMLRLVKNLTERMEKHDPQKVFLVSDSPRADRVIPGYATVADGTYQDSGCWMGAWPFGLFPNWRNTLWSCNWGSLSRFEKTKLSVERYGVPVAISNGWTDDRGPSEWTAAEREKIMALFRQRLARKQRVKFIDKP
ncbi:MAG: hypothetical protein JW959_13065 [Pirellulales bacterium]|nr:hypothetical protein [Pirellulales bacterium]